MSLPPEATVSAGIEFRVTSLLSEANRGGGYPLSLVCTPEGLPIAASGDGSADDLAGFTSIFEDVVSRAARDLSIDGIEEVTLRNTTGRHVIRPLRLDGRTAAFLVVLVPGQRSWRRLTNKLVTDLTDLLAPLLGSPEVADAV